MDLFQIINELYKINVIKIGNFELKDGTKSNFYIDVRTLYPI